MPHQFHFLILSNKPLNPKLEHQTLLPLPKDAALHQLERNWRRRLKKPTGPKKSVFRFWGTSDVGYYFGSLYHFFYLSNVDSGFRSNPSSVLNESRS